MLMAAKRPRVGMAECRARPTDPAPIQACFAINEFRAEPWLAALGADDKKAYKEYISANRGHEKVVEKTVQSIREYKALMEQVESLTHRAHAAHMYLTDLVGQSLSAYERGVWVSVVRRMVDGDGDEDL